MKLKGDGNAMSNKYFEFKELLTPPIKRAAYSDRTAWLMAVMSKLAYLSFEKDDSELKAALAEADFELVRTFDRGGTQAFLARRNSDKMAVLAFRGTQTQGDTLERFLDAVADLYVVMQTDENGVKVHKGFQQAFKRVEPEVLPAARQLADHALYITGHSLGGALALIAASAINFDNLAACYTFGSPKVGNEEFGDKIKSPIYRIINAYDIVPFLPFTAIMMPIFWLGSAKIKNDKIQTLLENYKKYRHHGDLRWLTHVKSNSDAKVQTECPELYRSWNLLKFTLTTAKDIGVQHHNLDTYTAKLSSYALKRL